jgi:hypothetical protein
MSKSKDLAEQVLAVAEAIREGEMNPLEFRLTQAYQDLRVMAAEIDSRIDIDEMLNEILGIKVSKVQELARILASPELYVERIKGMNSRQLAQLLVYKQPVTFSHLQKGTLDDAFTRIGNLLEAMTRESKQDEVPRMSGIPDGYAIETEDTVFLEDLRRFLESIPEEKKTDFGQLIEDEDFDMFLKRFLYLVVLISRGELGFDKETRQVWRI